MKHNWWLYFRSLNPELFLYFIVVVVADEADVFEYFKKKKMFSGNGFNVIVIWSFVVCHFALFNSCVWKRLIYSIDK